MSQTLDLDIDTGGEFQELITWYNVLSTRVDLSASGGYTAKLTIRNAGDFTSLLALTQAGSGTTSRLKLEVDSTQNDDYGEVSPSVKGVITIYINATDTATLSGKSGIYDLIMIPPSGAAHAVKLTKGSVNLDTLVST